MVLTNLSEMNGGELRELAGQIIRSHSLAAAQNPDKRQYHQELMDEELEAVMVVINERGRAIAKKYKKTFRPLELRGIKADMDAVLGRGGLQ